MRKSKLAFNCDYCRYDVPILDTGIDLSRKGDFYPGITVGIEDGKLWVISTADTYEPSYQEESVKINFCPMCGRELEKE